MRSIIDGNSLLFRAYYGVHRRLTRPDGAAVNAVYGFCNMLLPLIAAAAPGDEFICVFDAHRKNWRNEIYPAYKANRGETPADLIAQGAVARDAVRAMGVPCLVVPGVEADDVIATLCQAQCPTRVISSDKDLMQLVGPCCFMFDTMKGVEIREPGVFEKFGVKPSLVADCQALIGDSSDNIPGVHGIGPKKAAELLTKFGSLDGLYAGLDSVENDRVRGLLAAGRDSAFVSRRLARLKTDVEIPAFDRYRFDADRAREFFMTEVGSQTLAEKARKIGGLAAAEIAGGAPMARPAPQDRGIAGGDVFFFNADDYDFAPDLFSGKPNVQSVLDKLFDPNIKKVAWDWKAIFHKMAAVGIDAARIDPIDDVMLMNYAAGKTDRGDLQADHIVFSNARADSRLERIYQIDLAILRPLFDMETAGVLVDRAKLAEISESLHARADELRARIIALAGQDFNIASPRQLAGVLFDKLRFPANKKRSVDADALGELAAEHDIARKILSWRTVTKLSGTYADALPRAISADGRIHTTYLQTSTNTGRLSSVNPNLQNIPVKTSEGGEIRKCFIAPRGRRLITADYSQIQLRLLADIADVKKLKAAFEDGMDIHELTARNIFAIPSGDPVPKDRRRAAKTVNFSIIYGVSAFGLAAQLGVSRQAADQIIKNYLSGFPEIGEYMERAKKFALDNGFVETPMGRRIAIAGIRDPRMRSYAVRAAINAPIQGFEADIMRVALARLHDELKNRSGTPKIILQVHDELVVECDAIAAENAAQKIKKIMENVVSLSVPLVADYSIADRWEK